MLSRSRFDQSDSAFRIRLPALRDSPMRWFWLDRFTEFVSGSHATAVKCCLAQRRPSARALARLSAHAQHARRRRHGPMRRPAGERGLPDSASWSCWPSSPSARSKAKPARATRIRYHANIEQAKDFGASVIVKGDIDGRPFSEAEIFFARFDADSTEQTRGRVIVQSRRPARLAPRRRRLRHRRPPGRHPPPRRRLSALRRNTQPKIHSPADDTENGRAEERQERVATNDALLIEFCSSALLCLRALCGESCFAR